MLIVSRSSLEIQVIGWSSQTENDIFFSNSAVDACFKVDAHYDTMIFGCLSRSLC